MLSLPSLLSERVQAVAGIDPELRPATRPQFGHFQTNVALRLANAEGRPPREVAAADRRAARPGRPVRAAGDRRSGLHQPPAAHRRAGPGRHRAADRAGVRHQRGRAPADGGASTTPRRTWPSRCTSATCGPRSSATASTACCARRATRVIPQNHIGDWGTQFGMLVEQILEEGIDVSALDLPAAEALYQRANNHLQGVGGLRRPGPRAGGRAAGRRRGDPAASGSS